MQSFHADSELRAVISKSEKLSEDGKGNNAGVVRKHSRPQPDGKSAENSEEKGCR